MTDSLRQPDRAVTGAMKAAVRTMDRMSTADSDGPMITLSNLQGLQSSR
jgi:hypothetical protein